MANELVLGTKPSGTNPSILKNILSNALQVVQLCCTGKQTTSEQAIGFWLSPHAHTKNVGIFAVRFSSMLSACCHHHHLGTKTKMLSKLSCWEIS